MAKFTLYIEYHEEKGGDAPSKPLELPFNTQDEANTVIQQLDSGGGKSITVPTADGCLAMLSTRNIKSAVVKKDSPQVIITRGSPRRKDRP